nr:MAG TPA: hypothetical protein [Caudoviricetes sp.]
MRIVFLMFNRKECVVNFVSAKGQHYIHEGSN